MSISKKASLRQTWPAREAASKQAAAGAAESQKARGAAARETRNARTVGTSRAAVIRAHTQARGQRNQARRDSR